MDLECQQGGCPDVERAHLPTSVPACLLLLQRAPPLLLFPLQAQLESIYVQPIAGYQKLIDALEWCLELGVECVSVYAFSIDNYKRSLQVCWAGHDPAGAAAGAVMKHISELLEAGLAVLGVSGEQGRLSRGQQ